MRHSPILLLFAALGGCAGYAADHARPRTSIVDPQLSRFAADPAQARCLSQRLTAALSVRQLRRLADTAAALSVPEGRTLGVPDLVALSAHVRGQPVQPAVVEAVAACASTGTSVTAAAAAPAPTAGEAPAAAQAPQLWVNLGSAVSGQAIAVQVASVEQEGNVRTAWFRLTNPGQSAISSPAYRLRIDCTARTINSMAIRQYDAGGAAVAERNHGLQGEGALPVETGTVMELAFLALCT